MRRVVTLHTPMPADFTPAPLEFFYERFYLSEAKVFGPIPGTDEPAFQERPSTEETSATGGAGPSAGAGPAAEEEPEAPAAKQKRVTVADLQKEISVLRGRVAWLEEELL